MSDRRHLRRCPGVLFDDLDDFQMGLRIVVDDVHVGLACWRLPDSAREDDGLLGDADRQDRALQRLDVEYPGAAGREPSCSFRIRPPGNRLQTSVRGSGEPAG